MSASRRDDPPSGRQPKRKRGRYHHGDLRRALIDAALEMVATDGAGGVTLRGAARRAGVSEAAPYRHFADKESLLAAVAEQGFRAIGAQLEAAAGTHPDDPIATLLAKGRAYVEFAAAHPAQFRVMFGHEISDRAKHPDLFQAAAVAFMHFIRAVADCQQAGGVKAGRFEDVQLVAWSAVHGLAMLLVDNQPAMVGLDQSHTAALADAVTQGILGGIAAERGAQEPPD